MAFLDEDKERSMATSVKEAGSTTTAGLEAANFFKLSHGKSTLTYTASNIAGDPLVSYNNGKVTQSFIGDQILREKTALGTLVTVTLESSIDGPRHLLTLVAPEVLVAEGGAEKVSLPVIFSTVEGVIARRLNPGPVQTYDVKIFSGTASIRIT